MQYPVDSTPTQMTISMIRFWLDSCPVVNSDYSFESRVESNLTHDSWVELNCGATLLLDHLQLVSMLDQYDNRIFRYYYALLIDVVCDLRSVDSFPAFAVGLYSSIRDVIALGRDSHSESASLGTRSATIIHPQVWQGRLFIDWTRCHFLLWEGTLEAFPPFRVCWRAQSAV